MATGQRNENTKQVVAQWVEAFNKRDAAAAAELYHDDAINFQVAVGVPLKGRREIFTNFAEFFRAFPDSYTHPENLFEDGEWAILEWSGGGTFRGEFAGQRRPAEVSNCVAVAFFMWSAEGFFSNVATGTGKRGFHRLVCRRAEPPGTDFLCVL